jgi:hypothetical protein
MDAVLVVCVGSFPLHGLGHEDSIPKVNRNAAHRSPSLWHQGLNLLGEFFRALGHIASANCRHTVFQSAPGELFRLTECGLCSMGPITHRAVLTHAPRIQESKSPVAGDSSLAMALRPSHRVGQIVLIAVLREIPPAVDNVYRSSDDPHGQFPWILADQGPRPGFASGGAAAVWRVRGELASEIPACSSGSLTWSSISQALKNEVVSPVCREEQGKSTLLQHDDMAPGVGRTWVPFAVR